jgi:hypothetical protein
MRGEIAIPLLSLKWALYLTKLLIPCRLQLVSGIDLTGSVDDVTKSMKDKIKNVDTVTHVIFTAYIEKPDFDSLREINTQILKTGISAIDQLAPDLQSVVLQTGGKAYGVEFSDKLEINPPLKVGTPSHMLLLSMRTVLCFCARTTSMRR